VRVFQGGVLKEDKFSEITGPALSVGHQHPLVNTYPSSAVADCPVSTSERLSPQGKCIVGVLWSPLSAGHLNKIFGSVPPFLVTSEHIYLQPTDRQQKHGHSV